MEMAGGRVGRMGVDGRSSNFNVWGDLVEVSWRRGHGRDPPIPIAGRSSADTFASAAKGEMVASLVVWRVSLEAGHSEDEMVGRREDDGHGVANLLLDNLVLSSGSTLEGWRARCYSEQYYFC